MRKVCTGELRRPNDSMRRPRKVCTGFFQRIFEKKFSFNIFLKRRSKGLFQSIFEKKKTERAYLTAIHKTVLSSLPQIYQITKISLIAHFSDFSYQSVRPFPICILIQFWNRINLLSSTHLICVPILPLQASLTILDPIQTLLDFKMFRLIKVVTQSDPQQ